MSFVAEEDDDFGLPSANSKLSSLFRDTLTLPPDNKALTYTALKRSGSQHQQVKQASISDHQEVLSAAAVTCYKLNHDKYEALQGKVGFALLGDHEKHLYSIILYLNKKKPLTTSRVTKDFKFISQPDNFCTFYDDSRQNWAVLFGSSDEAKKIVSEVERVLAILGSAPPIPPKETNSVSTGSASDSPSNAEENPKTKLISRMAKLGQPILPLKGAVVAEDSDSDDAIASSTEIKQDPVKPKKPSRPERPSPQKPSAQPVNDAQLLNPPVLPTSYYSFLREQQSVPMLPYPTSSLSYTAPPAGNYANYYETLISETRTQNSEIRMHLCRLMDKIDHLAQQRENPPSDMSEFKSNFNKLLGQSNHQTEQLAELLNRVTISKSGLAEEANEKAMTEDKSTQEWQAERDSLKSAAKKLKDETEQLGSLMQIKGEEHQAVRRRLEQLEEENSKLRESLYSKTSRENETLRSPYEEENRKLKMLLNGQKIEKEKLTSLHAEELHELKVKNAKDANMLKEVKQELEEKIREINRSRQEKSILEEKLLQANQQIVNLKQELTRERKEISDRPESDKEASVIDQIKTIMNKVYKEVTKKFQPEETYSFKDIKATVGTVIRDTTLQMLNEERESRQEGPEKPSPPGSATISNTEENSYVLDEARKLTDQPPEDPSAADIAEVIHEESSSAIPILELRFEKKNNVTEDGELQGVSDSDHASQGKGPSEEMNQRQTENKKEIKEGTLSLEETLQTSLAAANSQHNLGDPSWKPDPPPLPPLRDFEDDDEVDWVS